jgi:phosphoribosylformylglycinamidine cyclo-ligase
MKGLTYKKAGVDIVKSANFKNKIRLLARASCGPEVLKGIGGFGAFFKFPRGAYRDPVLVSSADGVGTKLKIALLADKHDSVGIDAVAMNVNDILCTGARPLFFLDYLAYAQVKEKTLLDIVRGLKCGCQQAGCALVGGETAQMPGMYRQGEYDLAGFCVGVVERAKIIDGSKIKPGDTVIGLESNGLHSNGFSLVRKALSQAEQKRFSAELLKPTRIYVKQVVSLLRGTRDEGRGTIKGISHITGGAFYDKIARILPGNINARIYKDSWPVPKIFRLIQEKGGIGEREMYQTFNMGVGMALIVAPGAAKSIVAKFAKMKLKSWLIGEVIRGKKEVGVV